MGALHFVNPPISAPDVVGTTVFHDLDLFEMGGLLYIRVWRGGSGLNDPITMQITQRQADQLAQAAADLARRLVR